MEILQIQKESSDLGQETHQWPLLFNTAHLWQASTGRQATGGAGIKIAAQLSRCHVPAALVKHFKNPAHPSLSSPRGRRCHALYLTRGRLRTMQPAGSRLSPVTCSSAAISVWCYQLHKRERKKASLGSQFGGCFGPTDKQQDLVRGPEWSQAAHHLMTQKSKLE